MLEKETSKENESSPARTTATAGTARALLVGLTHVDPDKYPRDHNGQPWNGEDGCWGCDDDVAAMRLLLEREGYEVTVLLDEHATIPAVSKALKKAGKETEKGDTFFFYYSGHGDRLPDDPGKDKDEDDGWDETLCLYDGSLRDDVLNEAWVTFPKGSVIFMISDCCRAGTNFRKLGHPKLEPIDFVRALNGDKRMKAALLHIGGCKDDQFSAGMYGGGAFTTAMVKIWNKGNYTGTWDSLHDAITAKLPPDQKPQGNLYGPGSEKLGERRPFQPIGREAKRSKTRGSRSGQDSEGPDFTLESVARSGTRGTRDAPAVPAPASSLDVLGEPGSKAFVRAVQERLSFHGLYDPGAIDGSPGPFTEWALGELKIAAGTKNETGVGPHTAEALLNNDPNAYFPLKDGGSDLAAKTLRLMTKNKHWICRHPDCVNIIYLEGVSPDGTPNPDKPDVFNDLRLLVKVANGKPVLAGAWEGTTEPGRYWTENPMNPKGAARIAFGQYYAWSVGIHNNSHEALRQVLPITVHRDRNKDYKRTGDAQETGVFFINQHWGYDMPVSSLGNSSAGCLVGRTKAGHREFMKLVKADARAEASGGYKFTTAVMDGSELA